MLNIKSITIRNFMSVGAVNQAVNFDDNSLTLVLGQNLDVNSDGSRNGAGKTTLFNAISYAFYGEALTRIKVNNLINKTNNKNMIVSINFEVDGNEYCIERGRKPNILRFKINDEDVLTEEQQGDARETQKEIEKIIGFSFAMFKHLIILTMSTEPFLNMRPTEQRSLIEEVLGITELSRKAELLQEKNKETKSQIKEEEIKITTIENANARIRKTIDDIKETSNKWETEHNNSIEKIKQSIDYLQNIEIDEEIENHKNKANILELQKEQKTIEKEISQNNDILMRNTKKISDLNGKLTTINQKLSQLSEINIDKEIENHKNKANILELQKEYDTACNEKTQNDIVLKRSSTNLTNLQDNLATAKDGTCPSCQQSISHLDTHVEHLKTLEESIKEEQQYYDTAKENDKKLTNLLEDIQIPPIPDTFYSTLDDALEHKHNLTTLKAQHDEKTKETNPYIDQILTLERDSLESIDHEKINHLVDQKEHQEFLYKILTNKDSFIRKKIIDQNRAFLNNRFSQYLDELGLPHVVQFGNDLDVSIEEHGREMDFDNLSRGEKNRLILGLSWAFRDIYESLNRSMNLLCIDELIDSGMDTDGVENSLAVLKKMNRERGKNILLISHKEELISRVSNVLMATKENGFTSYNLE